MSLPHSRVPPRNSRKKQDWGSQAPSNLDHIVSKGNRRNLKRISNFPALALFSILFFPSHLCAQSALPKVNAAYVSTAGGFAVMWIAKEAKVFAKHGLDLQLIRVPGSPRLVQAVIGGDIHFAHTGGVSAANALARGADIVVLVQTDRGYSGHLIVKADINAFESLRGKKVGVPQYGSTADLFLREGLKRWNLKPDGDIAILQFGGTTEVFAALIGERIDAAVLAGELALRARRFGFVDLFDFRELDIKELGPSVIAKRSFVERNEDTVRKFLRAFVEGIYLYKTNKDLSLKVLRKYTRNDDLEILSAVREEYSRHMDAIPYPSEADLIASLGRLETESIRTQRKTKDTSIEKFLESKYLKELEQSGFVKQLYR